MVDSVKKTGSVDNPLAREVGTGIYLFSHPKPALLHFYQTELTEKLNETYQQH